jgi:tetratricopeptide (TPR) repeat protein
MHESAINELQKALRAFPGAATFLRELGYVYARSGQREAALKILEELQELSKKIYTSPYWRAQIYTALNEKDEAFRWLEAAYAERSALMAYLKVDPWLEDLHSDQRFQVLLRRMNLSE